MNLAREVFVREGALASVAVPNKEIGVEAAKLVNAILETGEQVPPTNAPRRSILFLNLKTARAIGLKIPPQVLSAAEILR